MQGETDMERIKWSSSGWLAILLAVLLSLGVIVSYVWAVIRKDVEAFIPFISDAGGYPPQSGVFAIFLFMAAFFGVFAMLIRYYSLKIMIDGMRWATRLNILSMLLGFVTMGGMIVVATYPVNTRPKDVKQFKIGVLLPHTLGALAAFSVGLAYAICQTIISFLIRTSKSHRSKPMILFYVRCAICILALIGLLVMSLAPMEPQDTSNANSTATTTTVAPDDDPSVWTSGKGKEAKILGEWVLAFALFGFFLSLYPEMKEFGIEVIIGRPAEFVRLQGQSNPSL